MFNICPLCYLRFDCGTAVCLRDQTVLILIQDEDETTEKEFAGYQILDRIASGSTSTIYRAFHFISNKTVALKLMHHSLAQHPLALKRFEQEATILTRATAPNIVCVHEFGHNRRNQPFIAMEYVEGVSLEQRLEEDGPINYLDAIPIFNQIADAIYDCHEKGIALCGLAAADIMINTQQRIKLLDFGLATWMPWSGNPAPHDRVLGKSIYCSPEQCLGQRLEVSTDLYSMGVILCQALTGRPPFFGSNDLETCIQHVHRVIPRFSELNPNVEVPQEMEQIARKLLDKNALHRFLSSREFQEALNQLPGREPDVTNIHDSHWQELETTKKRQPSIIEKLNEWKNQWLKK